MKLLIFGATGKWGRLLVRLALEAGHRVTAFVRDPSTLDSTHLELTAHIGDATV
ncbi:MAG: hypothetical protein ACI9MC_000893 [Kiritimatiellia bacterium]|jgi:uncharacterized protein YbjT (DUF2867 family)